MLPYNKLLFSYIACLVCTKKTKTFGETVMISWLKPVKPVPDECNTLSYLHSFWSLFALENAKSYNKQRYYTPKEILSVLNERLCLYLYSAAQLF